MSAFLSVLLLFSSFTVKASTILLPPFPDPEYSTHYLITYDSDQKIYRLYKPDPEELDKIYVIKISDVKYNVRFYSGGRYYYFEEGQQSWSDASTIMVSEVHNIVNENKTIIASSFDLKYENGDVFFQQAPIMVNLSHLMRKVKMGATMKTVVYLIPLLIVLLVSFLAFRKVLAWLLRVLRKA